MVLYSGQYATDFHRIDFVVHSFTQSFEDGHRVDWYQYGRDLLAYTGEGNDWHRNLPVGLYSQSQVSHNGYDLLRAVGGEIPTHSAIWMRMLKQTYLLKEREPRDPLPARLLRSQDEFSLDPKRGFLLEPGCHLLIQFRQEP